LEYSLKSIAYLLVAGNAAVHAALHMQDNHSMPMSLKMPNGQADLLKFVN
jgi:hypothetical protein